VAANEAAVPAPGGRWVSNKDEDTEMGVVRFALKYLYTFYVLAAFIVFLGVSSIAARLSSSVPGTFPAPLDSEHIRNI